jgi:hypothetical protein
MEGDGAVFSYRSGPAERRALPGAEYAWGAETSRALHRYRSRLRVPLRLGLVV